MTLDIYAFMLSNSFWTIFNHSFETLHTWVLFSLKFSEWISQMLARVLYGASKFVSWKYLCDRFEVFKRRSFRQLRKISSDRKTDSDNICKFIKIFIQRRQMHRCKHNFSWFKTRLVWWDCWFIYKIKLSDKLLSKYSQFSIIRASIIWTRGLSDWGRNQFFVYFWRQLLEATNLRFLPLSSRIKMRRF